MRIQASADPSDQNYFKPCSGSGDTLIRVFHIPTEGEMTAAFELRRRRLEFSSTVLLTPVSVPYLTCMMAVKRKCAIIFATSMSVRWPNCVLPPGESR